MTIQHLVVVDSNIEDSLQLLTAVPPNARVIFIDQGTDALGQIQSSMTGLAGLAALHIVAHGAPGKLFLGDQVVDAATLAGRAGDWLSIGNGLALDGAILLYACALGQGGAGADFVDLLAELSGCVVAASDAVVGLGRAPELSVVAGVLTAAAPLLDLSGYPHALANFQGDALANALLGTPDNDTILGLGGSDTIDGMVGDDLLDGGDGSDSIAGSFGNDTVLGGLGNDTLTDNQGANLLDGGDGNDTITTSSLASNDTLLGGAGLDRLTATGAAVRLEGGADNDVLLAQGYISGAGGTTYVVGGKAYLAGDAGADNLQAIYYSQAEVHGGDGNDTINGSVLRSSTLSGGLGDDAISGTVDFSASYYTEGDTTYRQIETALLDGGEGNDTLSVTSNSHSFYGQNSATLLGGAGNDVLTVSDNNASQSATSGLAHATLDGGDGADVLTAAGVMRATLSGGAGADRFVLTYNQYKSQLLGTRNFSNVDNTTTALSADPLLITDFQAGAGGDVLDISDLLRNGALNYDGSNPFAQGYFSLVQAGADVQLRFDTDGSVAAAQAPVVIAVLRNTSVAGFTADNFLPGYSPDGSQPPGLVITGDAAAQSLTGGLGNDTMAGLAGNDTLDGDAGSDVIDGGDGADALSGGFGSDSLLGGLGNDTLNDNQGANLLDGGDGNDTLTTASLSGNDTLQGGAGVDRLTATGAAVRLEGGADNDVLQAQGYISGAGGTTYVQRGTAYLAGDAGADNLQVAYYSQAELHGGDGNDTINGSVLRNSTLTGGLGDDAINATVDFSASYYTEGDSTYRQTETALLDGGEGNDTLNVTSNSHSFYGQNSATVLGGAGNDVLTVSDNNASQSATSGLAHATLDGGDGADVLTASGVMRATLTGGTGVDRFVVTYNQYKSQLLGTRNFSNVDNTSTPLSADPIVITDFQAGPGGDVIDISDLLRNGAPGYDGSNPFALDFASTVQVSADVRVRFHNLNEAGAVQTTVEVAVLRNVKLADLTADNFLPAFSPDGSQPPGVLITGDAAAQAITGGLGNDTISALAGNDTVDGSSGSDVIDGGDGADSLTGGFGSDSLLGGLGNDTLSDNQGANLLDGGDGNDTLATTSLSGNDTLLGGTGVDRLTATGLAVRLEGGADNDVLLAQGYISGAGGTTFVQRGTAYLAGDAGADNLQAYYYSRAEVHGGDGNDTINGSVLRSSTLTGGLGDDAISGTVDFSASYYTEGDTTYRQIETALLDGGEGNDTLSVTSNSHSFYGQNSATLLGGSGNDVLTVSDNNASQSASSGLAYATLDGGDGADVLTASGVMRATLSGGAGADRFVVTYNQYKSQLLGTRNFSNADNTTTALSTDAITITDFQVGVGGDVLDISDLLRNAGVNYDGSNPFTDGFLSFQQVGANTVLLFDADGPTGAAKAPLPVAVLQHVQGATLVLENFFPLFPLDGFLPEAVPLLGGDTADVIIATNGNDTIAGNGGNDQLGGLTGNDSIDGGTGNDTIDGGAGNDTLLGGAGNDSFIGSEGDDVIDGGEGDDRMSADLMGGHDIVHGSSGDDHLHTRGHTVELFGDDGHDWLHAQGALSVLGSATIMGGAGNDTILASDNSSVIALGGDGDDVLDVSGVLQATLTGGAGSDRFVLATNQFNTIRLGGRDYANGDGSSTRVEAAAVRITDFQAGVGGDVLDLGALLSEAALNFNGIAPELKGYVSVTQVGNDVVVSIDADGAAGNTYAGVALAVLQNVSIDSLVSANFQASTALDLFVPPVAPTSADATVQTPEDTPLTLGLAHFAFSDGNAGQTLQFITITTLPGAGALTLDGVAVLAGDEISAAALDAGQLVFTPAANDNGAGYASLGFTVSDGHLSSEPQRLNIDVAAVNDAPTSSTTPLQLDDSAEDEVRLLTTSDLLAGWSDADLDSLSIVNLSVDHGVLTDNGDGTWSHTPAADASGVVTLSYQVSDGQGALVEAGASWTVTPVNDAPVQTAELPGVTGPEDQPITFTEAQLIGAFSDVDGDSLSVVELTASAGTVVHNDDGSWTYTPARLGAQSVSLGVSISDGQGGSASATLAIELTAVDNTPYLDGDAFAPTPGAEDQADYFLRDVDLLAGWTTPHGDALQVSGLIADHGSFVDQGDGSWLYLPETDYFGPVQLQYSVVTAQGDTAGTQLAFTLNATNDAPVHTVPGEQVVDEDVALAITGLSITDNDLGDGIVSSTLSVAHGVVTSQGTDTGAGFASVSGSGTGLLTLTGTQDQVNASLATVVYQGDEHYFGADVLSLTSSDGSDSSSAELAITVNAVNDAPEVIVIDELLDGAEDTPIVLSAAELLFGVTDHDGDALTIDALVADRGEIVANEGGGWTYVPPLDYYGAVQLSYAVTDGMSEPVAVTRDFILAPVNDLPTLLSPAADLQAAQGHAFSAQLPQGMFDDVEDGQALYLTASLADGGELPAWLRFDAATGSFSGTPAAGDASTGATPQRVLAIIVSATDSDGASSSDSFTLTVYASRSVTGTTLADVLQGNLADENFVGLAGNDTISGEEGNDTLDGGAGTDSLSGGSGDDVYVVDAPSDVVIELVDQGTDTVLASASYTLSDNVELLTLTGTTAINATGNTLDNVLRGNSAANTLNGLDGVDTLIGGAGNDIYVVDGDADLITELAGEGTDTVQTAVSYTLGEQLENLTLTGTDAASATGNELANTLTGNTADNLLDGQAGADRLVGGAGDDTYLVDNIADAVVEVAAQGSDTVISAVSGYTLAANAENLVLTGDASSGTGNTAANVMTANAALASSLNGGTGNDTLIGGAGNDSLTGAAGNDVMQGAAGDDSYVVDAAGDVVTELDGEGIDSVSASVTYTLGANVEDLILTGITALNGSGNAGANRLTGNSAVNVLNGLAGADTLAGLGGNDTYVVDDASDVVVEALNQGTDLVQASVSHSLAANVENLTLTGTAAINATGNSLANTLTGNAADNLLDGGAGIDRLVGGAGNDGYVIDVLGDVVVEAAAQGTDTVTARVSGYTLVANVENLTLAGAAVSGTGNAAANVLTANSLLGSNLNGGAGNDRLIGQAGNDTLTGAAGNDTLEGGAGNDSYGVDAAADVIVELAGAGLDTVSSAVTYTLSANVENLTLTGTLAINGTGSADANTITGNSGANVLNGAAGADTLAGGLGNDTYVVDNAGDVVTEALNQGTDLVQSGVNHTLAANVENLTLTGTAVEGTGNTLINVIVGDALANRLDGLLGNDTLTGGAGNDQFIFDTALGTTNIDTITDFSTGDLIVLDAALFAGTGLHNTSLDATMFRQGAGVITAGDANDHLIFNTTNGAMYYDPDGAGGVAATQFATLTVGRVVTAGSIYVADQAHGVVLG